MVIKLFSVAITGIDAEVVEVELDAGPGQVAYKIIGLPDSAVFLSGNNGHLLVTSDGDSLWVASRVQAGKFPLGDFVPPRTE